MGFADMVAMEILLAGPADANITGRSFKEDRGKLMQ